MIFETPTELDTGSLLLRTLGSADAPALFEAIYGDVETTRYLSFARHRSVDDTTEFIETLLRHTAVGMRRCWLVTDRADGAVVGTIELGMKTLPLLEVGVTTSRRGPRRRVSMLHATRHVVDWALAQRSTLGVFACCATNNVAHGLLERLGFVRHAVLAGYAEQPNQGPGSVDYYLYLRSKVLLREARATGYRSGPVPV